MKKKIIAIVSGIVSAVSLAYFYDKYFHKSKYQNELLSSEAVNFVKKQISPRDYFSRERFFRENPLAILLLIIIATFLIFNGGIQNYLRFFQTSMIQMKYNTDPFDGAVYPITKVPKWTALTTAERKATYSQIPANKFIPLPRYSVVDFQKGKVWQANNERERNAYLTYPVPVLGDYKLDGTEGTGSHTGLDIKVPIGTPVHAISRGVVIKAKSQSTGFGKHIVVMHKDVPDPKNPAKKTTLYSAYAHLSQIKVKEGDQVQKGQVIGLSGMSGMATAPHLHFQIDTANAPFHPYWPFTWKEVVNHGLSSFFEAVKHGLNQNLAKKYTVHPMNLIARTIGYVPTTKPRLVATAGQSEQEISRASHSSNSSKKTFTQKKSYNPVNHARRIVRRKNSRRKFRFKENIPLQKNRIRIASRRPNYKSTTLHSSAKKVSKTASTVTKNISVSKQNPKIVPGKKSRENFQKYGTDDFWFELDRTFVPGKPKKIILFAKDSALTDSGVTLRTTSRDFVKIVPNTIKKSLFKNKGVEITLTTNSKKPFKVVAESAKKKIKSPTLLAKSFVDISSIGKERIFAEFVDKNKIITANAQGEFRPSKFLNRAEAVKAILTANKIKLNPAKKIFQDVNRQDWFAKYVSTAYDKGLVAGYSGKYFKPANGITKAEFLKMSLLAKGIVPLDTKFSPYRDVTADSWYEPYFSFARSNGLISPDAQGLVHPNKVISRIEAARILYKLSQIH